MVEELINLVVGNYRIKLFKHKVIKTGTFRTDKPYELQILQNTAFPGERTDFRETYHDYFKTQREAKAVIAKIPMGCKTNRR